jgi:hypothetical protein
MDNRSIALRSLDLLAQTPSDRWEDKPQYQEFVGGTYCAISGFATTLDFPTGEFEARIEYRSPISAVNPAASGMSELRLRIVRGTSHRDFYFGEGSDEDASVRKIHHRLYQDIRSPRVEAEATAAVQLDKDLRQQYSPTIHKIF